MPTYGHAEIRGGPRHLPLSYHLIFQRKSLTELNLLARLAGPKALEICLPLFICHHPNAKVPGTCGRGPLLCGI